MRASSVSMRVSPHWSMARSPRISMALTSVSRSHRCAMSPAPLRSLWRNGADCRHGNDGELTAEVRSADQDIDLADRFLDIPDAKAVGWKIECVAGSDLDLLAAFSGEGAAPRQ